MSTTTNLGTPAQSSSLASSATFKTFALVFAMATPIIYVICDLQNLPLFTYHPGPNRVTWLYSPAVRDQGPAMYWYGWSATTLISSAVLGLLATMLPSRLIARIPLALTWILPVLAVPVLIYSLKFFWRW